MFKIDFSKCLFESRATDQLFRRVFFRRRLWNGNPRQCVIPSMAWKLTHKMQPPQPHIVEKRFTSVGLTAKSSLIGILNRMRKQPRSICRPPCRRTHESMPKKPKKFVSEPEHFKLAHEIAEDAIGGPLFQPKPIRISRPKRRRKSRTGKKAHCRTSKKRS